MKHIFLDSYPLGLAATSARDTQATAVKRWTLDCLAAGHEVYLPEVIDYELRRELLRANKTSSIARLDALKSSLHFLPITSDTMLLAANLWAQSRQNGLPTGDPKKLNIDVILAAQALSLGFADSEFVIATSNARHLSRFAPADLWENIKP